MVGTADIQQLGPRVSFRLPLSIFDSDDRKPYEGDGWFAAHYFLEAFRGGATACSLGTRGGNGRRRRMRRYVLNAGHVRAGRRLFETPHGDGSHDAARFPATEENPITSFYAEPNCDLGRVTLRAEIAAGPVGNELKDVNGDGLDDLVLTFRRGAVWD